MIIGEKISNQKNKQELVHMDWPEHTTVLYFVYLFFIPLVIILCQWFTFPFLLRNYRAVCLQISLAQALFLS